MTSCFLDLNVWLALSISEHRHSAEAWRWVGLLPDDTRLIFCRYTQLGVIRMLMTPAVMGNTLLSMRKAWATYDRWLRDPRVEFHPEPKGIEASFRRMVSPFSEKPASKWVGDCYLLAFAYESEAVLVTYDAALQRLASDVGCPVLRPE